MEVESAVEIIQKGIVFKPEWSFEAESYTERHEGCIRLGVHYPAKMSERAEARSGYPDDIVGGALAHFVVPVAGLDMVGLCRELLCGPIAMIDEHERREFLRVRPDFWAPFHPHRVDGQRRFGNQAHDLTFGVC
jgi:hypothetical protein